MLTIDDLKVKGRTVFLRVDINAPVEDGRILDNERIRAHAGTIKELSDRGAKTVILGHQGRKGDPDFLPLKQHAALLSKHAGKRIRFIDDVVGARATEAIKNLKDGEILLLDNVRNLKEETFKLSPRDHSKGRLVKTLAPLGDFFINDAFSVSHRSHASVVGFTAVMKSAAGRVMQKEVENCSRFLGIVKRPFILVVGGKKPKEVLDIVAHHAPKCDSVLVSGVIGELFLLATGRKLGAKEGWIRKNGLMDTFDLVKKLYSKHKSKIMLPVDVAADSHGRKDVSVEELPSKDMIWDIGSRTIALFSTEIKKSRMLIMKGTPGNYLMKGFDKGTREILKAVEGSKAFSLLGGGDTSTAVGLFGIDKKKITYVSLAGGAFIEFVSGRKLPGIEALK